MSRQAYGVNRSKKERRFNWKLLLVVVLILFLASILIYWFYFKENSSPNSVFNNSESVDKGPQPTSLQGRYLFNGTIVLARMVEKAAGGDLSQPFSKINTFEPEKYDAMTLDWECPTTEEIIPYETQVNNLLFNCHKKWLPEVSKYFKIASLANNHSGDLGQAAFLETQKNLEAAGIQTYGNYDPSVKEDICEIIALPVRIQMPDKTEKDGKLPIAFCAWHYFFRQPEPGEMEIMEQYAKIMPVFGFQHAGAEYYATADPNQVSVAHKMIDLGAEFAIGNSPHWVQNGEVYKGKPIFYSTGNFIFDQIDYETMRGLSIDVSIEVPYSENVSKWLEIGEACEAREDNCLEIISQKNLQKIDIDLKYDVVGSSGGSRKVTQKADEVLQKAIEERVGWERMKSELGQTTD